MRIENNGKYMWSYDMNGSLNFNVRKVTDVQYVQICTKMLHITWQMANIKWINGFLSKKSLGVKRIRIWHAKINMPWPTKISI